jgi:hypothetical protein
MNAIQHAAFAASALAITLVGAALVTAPIAFAGPIPVTAHSDCLAPSAHAALAGQAGCRDLGRHSGLVALNRR